MYVPRFNALDDLDAIRAMVRAIGSAELVTMGEDGYPLATRLPVIWDGDRLVLHIARANPHWRSIPPRATCRARDRDRRGGVRVPGLVRVEGRARPGGADLELLGGPRHWAGSGATRTRSGSGARSRC